MIRRIFQFTCLFALLAVSNVSYAQSGIVSADPKAKVLHDALTDRVSGIMSGLTQKQAFHFMAVYANYTILSTVKAVREDVADAIEACGENNKSMRSDLNSRYEVWDKSLAEPYDAAFGNIKNMGIAQNYMSQEDLKSIFADIDRLRAIDSSNFEKTPVTSPEACEFMLSKMDETEQSMKQLMQMTMQSYPNILQQTQE